MTINCDRCGKQFQRKGHLDLHLKRKFPCKTNIATTDNAQNDAETAQNDAETAQNDAANLTAKSTTSTSTYACSVCKRTFTRKYDLKRHQQTKCKSAINELMQVKLENQELKERFQKLQGMISELLKQGLPSCNKAINNSNNVINNTINNNSNHTINNTINIVAYGNESVYDLNKDELKAIIDAEADAIPKCVEMIHFNPRLPFNHNILVTNLRANQMQVKQETGWKSVSADEMLDDLVRCKATNVRTIITKRMVDDVHATTAEMLLHQVHTVKNGDDEEKSVRKVKNDLKHKAKLTCYSNRNTVQNMIKDGGHDG